VKAATVIEFGDGAARKRIRESLEESLLVEAAAGTGKTSELVRRMVAVLAKGLTKVERIVAVTFTRKAAGELKLRLRQELDRARENASGREEIGNLEGALERLEEARIGTIHSFCAEILRERPVEAKVDPAFEELNEFEAPRLYGQAFRGWVQERLAESSPGLRRALIRLAAAEGRDRRTPMERLEETGWGLIEWRDLRAPWRREPFERDAEIDVLAGAVRELAAASAACPNPRDYLRMDLEPAREAASRMERAESVRSRDYDGLEGLLVKLLGDLRRRKRKGSGFFAATVSRTEVVSRRDALMGGLEDFRRRAEADLAAALQEEMGGLVDRYEELKRRSGRLDFQDLLIRARNLIRDNPDVRRHLQGQFTHLFVDEFQDTDPVQMEILLLLAADDPAETDWLKARPAPGKWFAVGDPKQSIYRFRRADVALYQQLRENLRQRDVALVHLRQSFRAVRPIQEFVNAAMAPEMTGEAASGQPEYVPLAEHRQANSRQPCLVALPAPRPYRGEQIRKQAVEACLPDAVAAFVEWLLRQSGWQVSDPEENGREVAVEPRHIAILFRRFLSFGDDMTRDYLRALEAREIPHLLLGSKSFHRREEVETLRAALTAVEWPDDELSVFAALRGSLFAISDAVLLRYKDRFRRLEPFRRAEEARGEPDFGPVAEALGTLAELHRKRNRRPLAETIQLLLEAARAHAGFVLRPAGAQVLANVHRVCDLARNYELAGGISFRGFVEELAAQAEKNQSAEAPALEEAAEGVRLLTVHTAKGLEFPVVILADITANLARQHPERRVDAASGLCATRLLGCAPHELLDHEAEEAARDRAEGMRLAYVAATRARDLLVVPAVGDGAMDGWIAPLNKALYPAPARRRRAEPAEGCPPFGESTVLERPMPHDAGGEFSVKPGRHDFAGAYSVVWWDPGALNLDVEANFGLRFEELLAEDQGSGAAADGARNHEAWKARREQALEQGRRAELAVLTATNAAEDPPDGEGCVAVEAVTRGIGRPSGRRFGTLLHLLLRDLDPRGDASGLAVLAEMHGRVLGAPEEEVAASIEAAETAARHPLVRRAAKAARCHREWPLVVRLDDGRILEGVIDLAFLEGGEWTVVDFKSGAELAEQPGRFERQLGWYVYGVRRITGMPARGCLLAV